MKKISVQQKTTVTCDACGKPFEIRFWPILNAQEEPKLKRKVLDTTLFVQTCPHCGKKYAVPYSMTYSDPKKKLLVTMAVGEKEYQETLKQNAAGDMYALMMRSINAEGELRLVRTPSELAEKAAVKECHYDDRIMELLKYHLKEKLNANAQHVVTLSFHLEGKEPYFACLQEDGKTGTVEFEDAWYQEAARSYSDYVKSHKDNTIVIDEKWARSILHPLNFEEEGEGVSIQ
jgi:transcription elongation factor Elf1